MKSFKQNSFSFLLIVAILANQTLQNVNVQQRFNTIKGNEQQQNISHEQLSQRNLQQKDDTDDDDNYYAQDNEDDDNRDQQNDSEMEAQELSSEENFYYSANVYNFGNKINSFLQCGSRYVLSDNQQIEALNYASGQKDQQRIYVLSHDGKVMQSSDMGRSWRDINYRIKKENKLRNPIVIDGMEASAYDSRIVYFYSIDGKSFKTKNCGDDFELFDTQRNTTQFKIHRIIPDTILGLRDRQCDPKNRENYCDPNLRTLYVSQDGGESWQLQLENVISASWNQNPYQNNGISISKKRMFATFSLKKGEYQQVSVLAYSDDFFESFSIITENCKYYYQSEYVLFMLVQHKVEETFSLKIARTFIGEFQPKEVKTPIAQFNDKALTIIESSRSQIYISLYEGSETNKITNILSSTGDFLQFNLILPLNVHSPQAGSDFELILSNEGVIIANIYNRDQYQQASKRPINENNLEAKSGYLYKNKFQALQNFQKSIISYDFGQTWHNIPAPDTNWKGEPLQQCKGECSLHLQGRNQESGSSILSIKEAPGVIIATGNVGIYLSQKPEDMNTYISRDGGETWSEIREKPHQFQIANYGSLILMARDDKSTNELLYSLDLGTTWNNVTITSKEFSLVSVGTVIDNFSPRFFIFGEHMVDNEVNGLLSVISFENDKNRVCEGFNVFSNKESDYELWIPINYREKECIFGKKMKTVRRKSDSVCLNSQEYLLKQYLQPQCLCTKEEQICDEGFVRDENEDGNCQPSNDSYLDKLSGVKPDDCEEFYWVTRGYMQLPASQCEEGQFPRVPIQRNCDSPEGENITESGKNNSKKRQYDTQDYIILILIVVILALGLHNFFQNKAIPISKNEGGANGDSGKRQNYSQLDMSSSQGNDEEEIIPMEFINRRTSTYNEETVNK